jgi:hypothetical protein
VRPWLPEKVAAALGEGATGEGVGAGGRPSRGVASFSTGAVLEFCFALFIWKLKCAFCSVLQFIYRTKNFEGLLSGSKDGSQVCVLPFSLSFLYKFTFRYFYSLFVLNFENLLTQDGALPF